MPTGGIQCADFHCFRSVRTSNLRTTFISMFSQLRQFAGAKQNAPRGYLRGVKRERCHKRPPKTINVLGAHDKASPYGLVPSFIRTIPSAAEFHRILRFLSRSWAIPPIGNFTLPRRPYILFIVIICRPVSCVNLKCINVMAGIGF
jgi:hypothetical protein